MPASLESLVENLKVSCRGINELRLAFKYTSEYFKNDDDFMMMIQKGIYPYDYISDFDKLNDKQLPTQEQFYSKLNDEKCKDEDYQRAIKVWNHFNCEKFLDYHNLYLKSDVLLLTDIFENFKSTCYKIYGLDPAYYYTSPSLSWDSFLKHKYDSDEKFQIELITDMDIYLFVESNIRGGLSQISKRYAKANNKYMSNYCKEKIDEYILYLDANNLYGYGMSAYLPQSNFKWNNEEWNKEKILKLNDEGDIGYLFDVDLKYPKKLHDLHNGYALAPQNMEIKKLMLSSWQQELYKESKIKKLVTNFYDKKSYGVNYRLLKLYLSLGLEIIKVNRVLQYKQSNFLQSYISKNTNERAKATNEFEKDFYKLMNNSVYGKTMENVRNRINFRLISSEKKALAIKNTRIKNKIFHENLVGVHLCKQKVVLNKPIFIG
jgi:hypothetical protein